MGESAKSAEFLNSLQAGVNVWVREIQKVTKLDRYYSRESDIQLQVLIFVFRIENMPATGDTMQEINFWLELEAELQHINEQLKSPEAGIRPYLLQRIYIFELH